jgi:hypothetical protein
MTNVFNYKNSNFDWTELKGSRQKENIIIPVIKIISSSGFSVLLASLWHKRKRPV